MYSAIWFIICAAILVAGLSYVLYFSRRKNRTGKDHFDVRHGEETGYRGPKEQPGQYF